MSRAKPTRIPPPPPAPEKPAPTPIANTPAAPKKSLAEQVFVPPPRPKDVRPGSSPSNRFKMVGASICGGFLLLFLLLSFLSVRGKSPTYDEPLHAMGAWANLHLHDFRINFEDPPLWKYWAALPNSADSIKFDPQDRTWQSIHENAYRGWELANHMLFQTEGVDGAAFINRSRFMMVLLGCALGILLTVWAWQLGGPVAAMIASGLFALDPNLLAHSGMIKNDVPMGLLLLAVFFACWHAGKRLTLFNGLAIAVLVAMAVNTKFSAVLLAPMIILTLAVRAVLPIPWIVLGRTLNAVRSRSVAAAALTIVIGAVSFVGIWASYGFRWDPSPDHAIQLNTYKHKMEAVDYGFDATHPPPKIPEPNGAPLKSQVEELAEEINRYRDQFNRVQNGMKSSKISKQTLTSINEDLIAAKKLFDTYMQVYGKANNFLVNTPPEDQRADNYTEQYNAMSHLAQAARADAIDKQHQLRRLEYREEVGDEAPDGFIRFLNIFLDHHLLPSAWLHGVLFVHARSLVRGSFLLGQQGRTGWWYYFPLAMLFKTPIGTILTLLASTGIGIVAAVNRRRHWTGFAWTLACLLVPFVVYMASAMGSNLNIGIRHILPMYPIMYLVAGVLFAMAIRRWSKPWMITTAILGILIAAETLSSYPNYIAFFNVPSSRLGHKGLDLLADSNLDWGQDLPLLAAWQKQHPDVPLAFGPAMHLDDYGPSGSYFGTTDPEYYGIKADPLYSTRPNTPDIEKTHVLAISATYLQGVYGGPFEPFRDKEPVEVLGGTIYLYDLRPKQ